VNSNIFTQIFGHSTVHLKPKDLHELKDLEYSKRSREDTISCIIVDFSYQTF
jgi:hypothetical protein